MGVCACVCVCVRKSLAQLYTYAMESVTHPVRLRYSAIQLEPTSMIDYSQLPVYVIFFPGRESECSV